MTKPNEFKIKVRQIHREIDVEMDKIILEIARLTKEINAIDKKLGRVK